MDSSKIDLVKLGRTVRFLRQGKGWALSELAGTSGVSKAYISDLENGVAGKPNIQYVYAIAVALDVTLNDLLSDAAAKPTERARRKKIDSDLPPGLFEFQKEFGLSNEEADMLAQVNFRGNRPKDKEGWRFLWEAIKLLGQRNPQR